MTSALAHDFPLTSPLSAHPPHAVPIAAMRAELAAEELHRLEVYPRRITKGRMTREQMDKHLRLWRAIRCDLARPAGHLDDGAFAGDVGEPLTGAAPDSGDAVAWADKVRELRGELAIRRNLYPRRIAEHGADAEALGERMAAIEAVHFHYWIRHAFCDRGPDWAGVAPAVARQRLRDLFAARDHWLAAAHAARDPAVRGWTYADHTARWYAAGGRDALARLCPAVTPPAYPAAA